MRTQHQLTLTPNETVVHPKRHKISTAEEMSRDSKARAQYSECRTSLCYAHHQSIDMGVNWMIMVPGYHLKRIYDVTVNQLLDY
ncbi:hypothetical protein [Acaryochloris marina]|uniref:Uncharacterized protein n=1 Tax=Acaryochloris marina (strain MBIC 11017) TaxID=329726 RepID=B0C5H1_ACAM1|nr:hypothetical protein [Acaryochloris marina]ABW27547.1 hypothetical protein AM1_2539 [Acaryochloris marina MBIC11017]BDM82284.1 hypothetical protein AM10699_51480 [Acaryochloris marina MBIC10699]